MTSIIHQIPETGFLRLKQIIGDHGDPTADPPIPPTPPIIPVSRSSWWQGVRDGRYPAAVKLGPRTTAWTVESIRTLIAERRA
ncbi:MAG: AlpA family phage regulatory protein [Deltaproteobacteria bacterium]|nr:AlpA family phage regulatory protein [Deltaproteobacteria bacterium]